MHPWVIQDIDHLCEAKTTTEPPAARNIKGLAAAETKLQQLTINSLVYGGDIYPVAWLCAGLLGVTLLSALLKFALNFRLSIWGEHIVRRLRDRLYANDVSDVTTGARETPKRGTLVTMLAAEAEAVGSFAGSAIAAKFALGAISVTGAVAILFPGGWLVLNGGTDVGTVVASLAGLTRIERPWRELVSFFRNASTVRVKYALLVRSLMPRQTGLQPGFQADAWQTSTQ